MTSKNSQIEEQGIRQMVWLPNDLYEITERVRKRMGYSRSGFYRYCVQRLLEQLNVMSTIAKEGLSSTSD
jgi:hypothetical protein